MTGILCSTLARRKDNHLHNKKVTLRGNDNPVNVMNVQVRHISVCPGHIFEIGLRKQLIITKNINDENQMART
jgi:hypothetical protein